MHMQNQIQRMQIQLRVCELVPLRAQQLHVIQIGAICSVLSTVRQHWLAPPQTRTDAMIAIIIKLIHSASYLGGTRYELLR